MIDTEHKVGVRILPRVCRYCDQSWTDIFVNIRRDSVTRKDYLGSVID
jgi:hypothetical protein